MSVAFSNHSNNTINLILDNFKVIQGSGILATLVTHPPGKKTTQIIIWVPLAAIVPLATKRSS